MLHDQLNQDGQVLNVEALFKEKETFRHEIASLKQMLFENHAQKHAERSVLIT